MPATARVHSCGATWAFGPPIGSDGRAAVAEELRREEVDLGTEIRPLEVLDVDGDGLPEGTFLLAGLHPGAEASNPSDPTPFDGLGRPDR